MTIWYHIWQLLAAENAIPVQPRDLNNEMIKNKIYVFDIQKSPYLRMGGKVRHITILLR